MNKGIQQTVTEILEESIEARNSDNVLVKLFYEKYFNRPSWVIGLDEVLANGVPTADAITRARRKVTQFNPALRGTDLVEGMRYKKQAEVIEWARG